MNTRRRSPLRLQRANRTCTLFQGPSCSGRSRLDDPVRAIHFMARGQFATAALREWYELADAAVLDAEME